MIVVSDTSPITNLFSIGRLDLLRELYGEVVIPVAVAEEIDFLAKNQEILVDNRWIEVISLQDRTLLSSIRVTLDAGEAEAIALSIELGAEALLMDETKGRHVAMNLGLDVTGLVGVLIQAKTRGLIAAIRPEIDRLVSDSGFWLSPSFIEETLRVVGE